jgi:hypothetical protein
MLRAHSFDALAATGTSMTIATRTSYTHTLAWLTLTLILGTGCVASSSGSGSGSGPDSGATMDAGNSADSAVDAVANPTDADTKSTSDIALDGAIEPDAGGDGEGEADTQTVTAINPDLNGDGTVNILVIGTNYAIQDGSEAFSPDQIAAELQNILSADGTLSADVNVVAEDIYRTKQLITGYGQGGDEYDWTYHCHSLAQYYFWPEGRSERLANLSGKGDTDWDQVIIGGDPTIVSEVPGYYSLGVNKVAAKIAEGDAQPLLLMMWPKNSQAESIKHFEEFTYRSADGAVIPMPVVPAGIAWNDLPAAKIDNDFVHPTPNGAYVAAAAIYAQMVGQSASVSDYTYDDELADAAYDTVDGQKGGIHYSGPRTFMSPFKGADISDRILNYNHTGTSSENGILKGLKWMLAKAQVQLQKNGEPPINFNYGRANTEFEAHKRYKIDPEQFDYSLGFPMQDHSNYGDTTMLYGLDKRRNSTENGTDLGVARKMVRDSELPYGRTIPVRTLLVQIQETIADQSGYSDGWHMNGDLDRATGAFMYTLLTGHCALDAEPDDKESNAWRSWVAHKAGYETAWNLMHLRASAPCFRVMPDAPGSVAVTLEKEAGLSISFANPPSGNVTVTLTTDNDAAVTYEPTELVFTPENFDVPQTVTMLGLEGELSSEDYTITASTESADTTFDGLVDRWTYTVNR